MEIILGGETSYEFFSENDLDKIERRLEREI
jgi:hypothetical protein